MVLFRRFATVLVALSTIASGGAALAGPPEIGADHTFLDPISKGTVFCDTMEQIVAIATAEAPDQVYGAYRITANERDEPTCMAIAPTALVIDVVPIGVMVRNGSHYNAWAIEADVEGVTVFALYVERFKPFQA